MRQLRGSRLQFATVSGWLNATSVHDAIVSAVEAAVRFDFGIFFRRLLCRASASRPLRGLPVRRLRGFLVLSNWLRTLHVAGMPALWTMFRCVLLRNVVVLGCKSLCS